MKTPKLYNELINEKKITNEIIAECIYSVNKRAKNYRDKIKEYKNGSFHQHLESNIEKAEEEMGKYYQLKEEFLKVFTPTLIHKQFILVFKFRLSKVTSNFLKSKDSFKDSVNSTSQATGKPYSKSFICFSFDKLNHTIGVYKVKYALYYHEESTSFRKI